MEEMSIVKKKYYEIIHNIVVNNKLSHAYLIELSDYADFYCVLDFVKLILCHNSENFNVFDCDNNDVCKQIDNNYYPDLKIVEPDGNYIKKQQLLDLKSDFQNKSLLNNKRIYIIKEADKLNDSSANTILKFLEEPEDDIIAILVTNNRYKVIDTIISRCQILSVCENNELCSLSDKELELIEFIIKKDELFINYQYILSEIIPDKACGKNYFVNIENALIKYLDFVYNSHDVGLPDNLKNIFKLTSLENIVNYIAVIEEELPKLEYNVNYKLWLDCLFAKLIGG